MAAFGAVRLPLVRSSDPMRSSAFLARSEADLSVLFSRLLLVFALATLAGACTKSNGNPDGDPDGGIGDVPDGDGGDEEPIDEGCKAHADCEEHEYCELSTGECLPAKACDSFFECWEHSVGTYCDDDACFCDPDRKRCLPRTPLCQSCKGDEECGDDPFNYGNYTAVCVDFQDEKVCLPTRTGTCPPGYMAGAEPGYCVPGGGSCSEAGACTRDADCDPMSRNPVCDTRRGFCVEACEFDYLTGDSSCGPGLVCHVDSRLLRPGNPNFGKGKCGRACEGDDPFLCSEGTVCTDDGDPLMSTIARRCRPELPTCIRDADCPASEVNASWGYCNTATLACSDGCRRDEHCFSGYACNVQFDYCEQKPCNAPGRGAALACDLSQFCCGEEGSPDCPNTTSSGACYDAPNPPWCGDCNGSAVTPPGGAARPQPSRCVTTTERPGAGTVRKMWHSCDPMERAACPRGWDCAALFQWCDTDADCGAGGECSLELNIDGIGKLKACACHSGQSCPSPSECHQPTDQDGNPSGDPYCRAYWCDNFYSCLPPVEQQ